jgi:hypothetical protein
MLSPLDIFSLFISPLYICSWSVLHIESHKGTDIKVLVWVLYETYMVPVHM